MEYTSYENTLEYLAALKREVLSSEKGLEYKGRLQNLADSTMVAISAKFTTREPLLEKQVKELSEEVNRLRSHNQKLSTELEKLRTSLEEQEARSLAGFDSNVLISYDDKAVRQQVIDTDSATRLAQTEKENNDKDKQLEEMKSQVKMLKEKLGKETIPLSTLVEGVKRYAELKGINEGKDMLEHLTYVLKKVSVWIDNVEPLENFFIAAEQEEKKLLASTVNYNDIHNNQNVPVGK